MTSRRFKVKCSSEDDIYICYCRCCCSIAPLGLLLSWFRFQNRFSLVGARRSAGDHQFSSLSIYPNSNIYRIYSGPCSEGMAGPFRGHTQLFHTIRGIVNFGSARRQWREQEHANSKDRAQEQQRSLETLCPELSSCTDE